MSKRNATTPVNAVAKANDMIKQPSGSEDMA
jgi:hypothetical protein